MMGGKLVLSLDKRDHNSTVGVMYYDLFVGMILAFFLKAALLDQIKTVKTEPV
jgi:hypothetical protein